jgi:hypothetical protein
VDAYCDDDLVIDGDADTILEVESDGVILAWRTATTTMMRSLPTNETLQLMAPISDLEVGDGAVFGVNAAGDVVRHVFPQTTPQVIAVGPSDASLLRLSGNGFLSWLSAGDIVKADLESGDIETVFTAGTFEVVDFVPDGAFTWVAGYEGDMPRYFVLYGSDTLDIDTGEAEPLTYPIDIEVDDEYGYLGQGDRLLLVDKNEEDLVALDVGNLSTERDEMRVRAGWVYTREGARLEGLPPDEVQDITFYDGTDPITSMTLAADRVFFTTDAGILSVPW